MVPTRSEIQQKLDEFNGMQSDKQMGISNWLDDIECPLEDKEKIMSDLETYVNY